MAVEEAPKEVRLTLKEAGAIADSLIDFSLVPNRRIFIEAANTMDYSTQSSETKGEFSRRLRVTKTEDGVKKEATLVSDRRDNKIIGGVVYFSISRADSLSLSWAGTREAQELAAEFLSSIAQARS
ncbi:MAG TPA: hypothetical protein VKC89_01320 [Patescibacteria group bacterium]|nr:hypothetical protein [Patescibacteria group bacterium]